MNYFLLKLAFDTAVHFGGSDSAVGSQSSALTLRADTIFSALCHTALEVYGEPALEELLVSADADALRISDAMPWRGDTFYLPKPIAASTSPAELSTVERKAVKKLAWIPASKFATPPACTPAPTRWTSWTRALARPTSRPRPA